MIQKPVELISLRSISSGFKGLAIGFRIFSPILLKEMDFQLYVGFEGEG
jgi:hypothetical protein